MRSMQQRNGFTLIELMISVAIVGILSATAISLFRDQQLRSKRTEGLTNLSAIATMQRGYYGEAGTYADIIPPPAPPIGPAPRPWTVVAGAAFDVIGFAAEGAVYYDYDVASGGGLTCGGTCQECFTVSAYGDLDGNLFPSVLSYVHPDTGGLSCPPQAVAPGPPLDPNTGLPIYDSPARHLLPIDPY